jgi:RNA polymerase sigma-70 factor (ECF subfamily)
MLGVALRRLTWPGCDLEDLLQEVFVIALRRPLALLTAESPRAWLYGVTVKVAAAARRRHRLRSFLGLDAAHAVAASDDPHADAEARETKARVQRALASLPAKKRDVLVLFELEGLTGPEISTALGCPVATVWTRLHHARRDFEKAVRRHD